MGRYTGARQTFDGMELSGSVETMCRGRSMALSSFVDCRCAHAVSDERPILIA